jgi:hypothetical protein
LQHFRCTFDIIDTENQHCALSLLRQERVGLIGVDGVLDAPDFIPG